MLNKILQDEQKRFADFYWERGEFEHRERGIEQYQAFLLASNKRVLEAVGEEVSKMGVANTEKELFLGKKVSEMDDKESTAFYEHIARVGYNKALENVLALLSVTEK